MSLPANIRVNVKAPFPANVSGAGFVVVLKANGVYTIQADYTKLAALGNPADLPGALIAIYDPITKLYSRATAAQIAALGSTLAIRTQRSITGAGGLPILASDSILNVNAATDLVPLLPVYSTRNGAPITFNVKSTSNAQTVTPVGGDTIDGNARQVVVPGSRMTFWPYNDGVNTGWFID